MPLTQRPEEEAPAKVAAPNEKRGRGRPRKSQVCGTLVQRWNDVVTCCFKEYTLCFSFAELFSGASAGNKEEANFHHQTNST